MSFRVDEYESRAREAEKRLYELETQIKFLKEKLENKSNDNNNKTTDNKSNEEHDTKNKKEKEKEKGKEEEKYTLYYHNGLKNRGNAIRLLFEYSNTPYKYSKDIETVSLCFGKTTKTDVFAPPVLQYNDSYLSQTSPIVQFVATKLNLRPKCDFDNARADMLVGNGFDITGEIYNHKADDKQTLLTFLNGRFQIWLDTIEKPLVQYSKQDRLYYFENRVTHADLSIFNTMDALEEALSEKHFKAFVGDKHPILYRHYQQIGANENIRKFLDDQKKHKVRWFPESAKIENISKVLESQ